MCAITPKSNELFSHAKADEVASDAPVKTAKASHQNLFSQPTTEQTGNEVARPETLPRNPFQV